MGHSRSALKSLSIGTVVFFSLSGAAGASPVDTIFAAENALYGQGYDIGQADGWLDDDLRAAIKAFQSRTSGILATGNLDPETLKALGIDPENTAVSRNTLPNRHAAMAALGLKPRYHKPVTRTPKPTVAAAPDPKPKPAAKEAPTSPEPRQSPPTVAAKPEPKAVAEPATNVEKTEKASTASASHTKTAAVEATPSAPERKPAGTTDLAEPNRASKQASIAAQPVSPKPLDQAPAKSDAPEDTEATVGEKADEVTVAKDTQTEPAATTQPAALRESEAIAAEDSVVSPKEPRESSGGFFSRLFDLLFGWAV